MKLILRMIALSLIFCMIFMTACNSSTNKPVDSSPTASLNPIATPISSPAPEPSDAPTSTPEETAIQNEEWKAIYKEFLKQYTKPEGDLVLFGMALMDINGDSMPELVLSSSSYWRNNDIYTISNGGVEQLGGFTTNYQDKVSSNLDVTLYKNKETNNIQWIAKAGTSEGDEDGLRTTLIDMNPVQYETPGFFVYTNTSKNEKHWLVNNAEVSEAVYKEKYKGAFDVLEAVPYTVGQYEWNPASNAADREPIIMSMLQEYQPFSLSQSENKPKLQFVSYYPESSNISVQMDFDLDGSKDSLTLTRDSAAPKLRLDMNQNGIITFELAEYEYGSIKKIMSGDLTGDGFPEILILADMGGNGLAAGSCALYGFSRMNGEWNAMEFPFLEYGAIKSDYSFEGKFVSGDIISVQCMPANQKVDTINNDNLQFKDNFLEQTYKSSGLTQILFEYTNDSVAYDLLLLQEMRNEDGSEIVGNGVTKYSFIGGPELILQMFHFKQDYRGR